MPLDHKTIGYTHCPCCGIDSMDNDLCAYCEEGGCHLRDEDGDPTPTGDYWDCLADSDWSTRPVHDQDFDADSSSMDALTLGYCIL